MWIASNQDFFLEHNINGATCKPNDIEFAYLKAFLTGASSLQNNGLQILPTLLCQNLKNYRVVKLK